MCFALIAHWDRRMPTYEPGAVETEDQHGEMLSAYDSGRQERTSRFLKLSKSLELEVMSMKAFTAAIAAIWPSMY